MVELDQFKYTLSTYETPLKEVRDSLNLEAKIRRIDELDKTMEEPSFWEDAEKSTRLVKEAKNLKDTVAEYNKLQNQYEEIGLMIEMGYEENDPEIVPEIQEMLDEFTSELDALRLRTLLTGEYDNNNAILRLNAGAGGTESCDWCSMLYRMYCRWAERKGYQVEVLDFLDGEEAGIKSVTIQINGENAFGYLKSERGVHRLVRISPFNANGKRQTSFVSCDVMPDIEEDLDIEINPDDLRIDTYRSSDADVKGKAVYVKAAGKRGEALRHPRRYQRYRMGKPDPFLCTPAVHDGKRPPDRLRERKRKCGARRRTRRLYQCLPEVGEPWTAAGEGRTGRRIERDGNAVRRNCYHEKSVSKDVIIHRLIRFFYTSIQ